MTNNRHRHTPEQIIGKLDEGHRQLAAGVELVEVCRNLEIAESMWHRWLARHGGMKANDAKRLKELEGENAFNRSRALNPTERYAIKLSSGRQVAPPDQGWAVPHSGSVDWIPRAAFDLTRFRRASDGGWLSGRVRSVRADSLPGSCQLVRWWPRSVMT